MSPEIQTFLLAMTPIGELRLALPLALTVFNLNLFLAYLISVLGNLIPVIVLLLFLDPVSRWLSKKFTFFGRFFSWLFERTRRKYDHKMEKYGHPALVALVAIPLPITGGWTGSLIAFLFGIPFKRAFPLIAAGVMIAGAIVSLAVSGGIAIERYFGWQVLVGVLVVAGFVLKITKIIRNKKYAKI